VYTISPPATTKGSIPLATTVIGEGVNCIPDWITVGSIPLATTVIGEGVNCIPERITVGSIPLDTAVIGEGVNSNPEAGASKYSWAPTSQAILAPYRSNYIIII
jgi:hypothetical protein